MFVGVGARLALGAARPLVGTPLVIAPLVIAPLGGTVLGAIDGRRGRRERQGGRARAGTHLIRVRGVHAPS